jgi:hypothetical protein
MNDHSGNDERFSGGLELAILICGLLMPLAAGTALVAAAGTDPQGFVQDIAAPCFAGLVGMVMTLVLFQPWRFGSELSRLCRIGFGVGLAYNLFLMGLRTLNRPIAVAEYFFPPSTESVAIGIVAFVAGAVAAALVCLPSQIAYWARRGGWARPRDGAIPWLAGGTWRDVNEQPKRTTRGFNTESGWDVATYSATFLITFAVIAYAGYDFGYSFQTILSATAGTLVMSILVQRSQPPRHGWYNDAACAGPVAALPAFIAAMFLAYFIESRDLLERGIIHSKPVLHIAVYVMAPFLGGAIGALLVWLPPVIQHRLRTRSDARGRGFHFV